MAGNAAGERKLFEELLYPLSILGNIGVHLAVCALQVGVGDHARSPMPRAADVDHVEVVLLNHAIEMYIDEVQPRRGASVSKQSRLDVCQRQGFLQQGIVKEIDLANGQVIGRPPVCMHGFQF
jgi:hypothetical protein